ncbi:hypothetical protein ASA1KI_14570 [Opitutales bacterium ASA1]|uniref:OadG family transporter subunit n=1 Tax=Congregicoccus parvus TaxID=3081749 RepID=UPI002B3097A2|nr:hypothetical protein ASA1KI_14570 [Opitutales bacterium ASA1]
MNFDNVVQSLEHLTGFVIVMLALSVLWGLTALMGRVMGGRVTDKAADAPARAVAPPAPVLAAAPAPANDDEDDALIVVAAAAAALLQREHRIVAVRPIASSWGQQGRRDIHASHRIR